MLLMPLILLGLLTAACVWARAVRWLRVVTVVGCVLVAFLLGPGLWHAARAVVITDDALLRSTARYGDAYEAGSDATQQVVNRNAPSLALLYAYLAILALVPLRTKPAKQRHDAETEIGTSD
jgi:hypothetical protein